MTSTDRLLLVYRELADWHERQGLAQLRDRFLMLAAAAALSCGRSDEAERLRQRLLRGNPHHLLKPFGSFVQAMQSADVQAYLDDLRRQYPLEKAENLLDSLRGHIPNPRHPEAPFLPPTAPDIDIGPAPDEMAEPLKVYRVRDEPHEDAVPILPAWEAWEDVPTRSKPASRSRPTRTTLPRPLAMPVRPSALRQPAPRPMPAPSAVYMGENDDAVGSWVGALLFVVVLAAGVALAVYTFASPFLPPDWLP
jgi:hypothetical protein